MDQVEDGNPKTTAPPRGCGKRWDSSGVLPAPNCEAEGGEDPRTTDREHVGRLRMDSQECSSQAGQGGQEKQWQREILEHRAEIKNEGKTSLV